MAKKWLGGVGYGNPPVHSRFEQGKSGNPKGRPKGSYNSNAVILKISDKRVAVKIGGRRVTMRKFEAILTRLTNQAMQGDLGAAKLLIELRLNAENWAQEKQERPPSVLILRGHDADL